MNVQIFGVKSSQASRAAERFFKERRIELQMVDLNKKPMSPGEMKRFADRFGLPQLIDRESKGYIDGGLQYMKLTDADWLARIERDPKLLRLPLGRSGNKLAVGQDEAAWKAMLVT